MDSVAIGYDWRSLLSGKLNSATLAGIDIRLHRFEQAAAGGTPDLEASLPGDLISALPLKSLDIDRWHMVYQPYDQSAIAASGQLRLAHYRQ